MVEGKIKDIMTTNLITLTDDVNIGFAAHALYRQKISGVLIVDKNDKNKLIGIFTTTDLLKILGKASENPETLEKELKQVSAINVGEYASKSIIRLQQDETIL